MSLESCSETVARGDPDRFLSAMAAEPEDRARLMPLYAFNLEIARAPWVSQEPLIAQMRLQFWHDALDALRGDAPVPAHEVMDPLAQLVRAQALPIAPLQAMVAARQHDIARAPFDDAGALRAYLDATAGNLMWVAAHALGATDGAEPVVRDMAAASGLAAWLVAVPELEARGRQPLADGRPQAIAELAREGLAALRRARARRSEVARRAAPALLAGWRAGPLLRQAAAEPGRVGAGQLVQSEFARRGSLLLRSATGRW